MRRMSVRDSRSLLFLWFGGWEIYFGCRSLLSVSSLFRLHTHHTNQIRPTSYEPLLIHCLGSLLGMYDATSSLYFRSIFCLFPIHSIVLSFFRSFLWYLFVPLEYAYFSSTLLSYLYAGAYPFPFPFRPLPSPSLYPSTIHHLNQLISSHNP